MRTMKPKTSTNKLNEIMTEAATKTKNVRCSMMLEPEVHRRLKMYSAKTGKSMSKLINQWIKEKLDRLDRQNAQG